MKRINLLNILLVTSLMLIELSLGGCSKGFLDAKPNTDIVTPSSLSDFQQLLDDTFTIDKTSSLGQLSCDEYYYTSESAYQAGQPTERNAYIWNKDVFGGQVARQDWNDPYQSVFYANSAISGLSALKLAATDQRQYYDILGQAYFMRAYYFFDLVKNFSPPYDDLTASSDLGIPLKLTANVNENVQRSSVLQTYNQIIADLNRACSLLSPSLPTLNQNRGSKPSAYALFARMYLSMRKYSQAELYADSSLALYNKLVDYNTVNATSTAPFLRTNAENLYYSSYDGAYTASLSNSSYNINIDTNLLTSYNSNDLRRSIFFITNPTTKLIKAKDGYSQSIIPFAGLATDEVYLIKAECAARRQDAQTALQYLNALLLNRFTTGTYVPYTTNSTTNLLSIILMERRKELVWRSGLRWDDLRRLNKEGANITLTRVLNGVTYKLTPNSPLYTFPIPDDEIAISGIQQNAR